MKSYSKELWFDVPTRRAFINITPQAEKCLKESAISLSHSLLLQLRINYVDAQNSLEL